MPAQFTLQSTNPQSHKLQHKKFSLLGKLALLGIVLFLLIIIVSPYFLPYSPDLQDLDSKFAQPSIEHIFGTDYLGRDIATRLVYGARISLFSAFFILAIILLLGMSIGGICGFMGGVIDRLVMRICDIFLSLPTIVLSLFLVGVLGSGLENIILAIALTHWAWYARIVRSIVLNLKNKEFVLLSQTFGLNKWQSFKRNIFIPVFSQCIVLATMDIGHIILHIAGLSFLGVGVQPPQAEWGVMLSDCKDYIWSNPSLLIYPGAALFITIALFNLLGDSLRDYFDVDLESLH
ncbi:nickel ABC transporter permease subunit NikC [Helicobacter aurati]|uniref:Nickel ABC transporter permease subunit NikC n=1 Tax=Helicobacter aurati TaxID=137778 RepID=A0A3D8IZD2_9HELI|nr:nickel ABC transporter permease subunit NikC [Helicobacter aurati]RDU70310.1 nickel ABC transporter permease subunit NikC [Helicobacter aurati]